MIPLPPLPAWLLAACSPKSSVVGWGPEGAAAALSLLVGLEASTSLVTRDLPAEVWWYELQSNRLTPMALKDWRLVSNS